MVILLIKPTTALPSTFDRREREERKEDEERMMDAAGCIFAYVGRMRSFWSELKQTNVTSLKRKQLLSEFL